MCRIGNRPDTVLYRMKKEIHQRLKDQKLKWVKGQMMKKINWKEYHLKKTKLMTHEQEKEISSPLLIEGLNDTDTLMC